MYNNKNYYKSIDYNIDNIDNNNSQVWYTHYRGYITKSWIDKNTNKIVQEKIQYNQPDNYSNFLKNYFMYKLK